MGADARPPARLDFLDLLPDCPAGLEDGTPYGSPGSSNAIADRYVIDAIRAADAGKDTWSQHALGRLWQALEQSDPAELRSYVARLAALCVAWLADIDSRPKP